MNKELVYRNMSNLINNGFFLDKYIELTTRSFDEDIIKEKSDLDDVFDEEAKEDDLAAMLGDNNEIENIKDLEEKAAGIFNAIIIGCQLFDEIEKIKDFVDMFSDYLDPYYLEHSLPKFGISKQEAIDRLNHGFAVHFTTPKIAEEIQKSGKLAGAGKNALLTEEENKIIDYAAQEQKKNDPKAEETLNYLFRGWGTGVSSYGSTTNGFWMYHTPESLSFLFGNISKRNKEEAMRSVNKKISSLNEEDKRVVSNVMSNIYDRLIGDEQNTCCILIDRDAFDYEVNYHYKNGVPVEVERRTFSTNLSPLNSNDSLIKGDVDASNLKFLKVPTVLDLELQKKEQLINRPSHKL